MATAVSICSNALVRLGASPMNSFDEADPTGSNLQLPRTAGNLWPTVRDAILRDHLWNCCIKRQRLSAGTSAPPFGWSAAFRLPDDWVRTIEVLDSSGCQSRYRAEGAYLLSDEATVDLVYVFKNLVPETYDTSLVQVLELAMMHALAYPVTKSTSLVDALGTQLYGPSGALARARALDGQDDTEMEFGDNPSRSARFGGWGVRR